MEPFRIQIDDAEIADLRDRLARTRWPGEVANSDWGYGTDLSYMKDLVAYWLDSYDWRGQEARLNEFAHYRTEIDGFGLHFIHERGNGPAPIPIVLSHGWPSTFYEMTRLLPLLTDPGAHGGDPADAFDVIVPSLPGYGFSEIPTTPGMSPRRMAALFAGLMTELGYDRFGAHGGDFGGAVTSMLGYGHAERIIGLHMTMLWLGAQNPDGTDEPDPLDPNHEMRKRYHKFSGYSAIQSTQPQTLSYGLTDSPAGLAAWILQFGFWRSKGEHGEDLITNDDVLTNISIYWHTRTINSSTRLYFEHREDHVVLKPGERVEVPTGFAWFGGYGPPRERAERRFDVRHWSNIKQGGHLAGLDAPQQLAEDLRTFFRPLR